MTNDEIVKKYEKENISISKFCKKNHIGYRRCKRILNENNIKPKTKRMYNKNAFSEIKTEEDAYWLGFLTADGYVCSTRKVVRLKLAEKDSQHLIKFAKYMGEENPHLIKDYGGSYTRDNVCYFLEYSGELIVNNLAKYGVTPNKSTKEKPYIFDDEFLNIAYLRGLIDGDGWIVKNEIGIVGSYDICSYVRGFFIKNMPNNSKVKEVVSEKKLFSF